MANESAVPAPALDTAKLEVQAALYKAEFTQAVEGLESNLQDLFGHVENVGAHLLAIEAVLRRLVQDHGVSFEDVKSELERQISESTGGRGDASAAVEAARGILGA